MRLALVHDWFNNLGGAERVLIELHKIFPEAPIYALFAKKKFIQDFLSKADIRTSSLQKFPFISKLYKYLFFAMPSAIESFDLSDFDVIISSSVIFSKGLVLKPKTRHICYCYSPTRFLWDRHAEYENQGLLGGLSRHLLRIWDRQASDRVDEFVAISEYVRDRIRKYYRRDSKIIYPPTTITTSNVVMTNSDLRSRNYHPYYLIVSRLFPHKNIDVAIDAFNKLGYELVIIGDGPARKDLEKMARKNIRILGFKNDVAIKDAYQNCKAFIMPQEEDFGLTPIEAMSFGKPVLALRKGGALETVVEGVTGEFFDDPIPEALADGIRRLNDNYQNYDPSVIHKQAEKFSRERFKKEILSLINRTPV